MKLFKICLYITFLFISCRQNHVEGSFQPASPNKNQEDENPNIAYNKKGIALENENIILFLKRYGWQPMTTPTGLRIEILQNGRGDLIKTGNTVKLKYETKLLSGELVYSSQTDGMKSFVVDKSEEISGLHEAAKMLKKESKARLIIPSYLAYGLVGDGNYIIGRQPLVMIVEVIDVQ